MSTKRTLLHESRHTLQNQYAYSLTQKNTPSRITASDDNNPPLEMVPIIGGSRNQTTIREPGSTTHQFNLIHCHGWVRSGRIWIQVAAKYIYKYGHIYAFLC